MIIYLLEIGKRLAMKKMDSILMLDVAGSIQGKNASVSRYVDVRMAFTVLRFVKAFAYAP